MTCAIMQPYFFPYIGYFQMIQAVDYFVFYDDVNFIKRGWVNRNRILVNDQAKYITVPLIKASQNKLIDEIEVDKTQKEYTKILKTLEMAYKKAPFFSDVFELLSIVMQQECRSVADIAINSVEQTAEYLGLTTKFYRSSESFSTSKGKEKAKRLQDICHKLQAKHYINAMGGKDLYDKTDFVKQGIKLNFIKPHSIQYEQFGNKFEPWLSIIDVMMFNDKEEIREKLKKYDLE